MQAEGSAGRHDTSRTAGQPSEQQNLRRLQVMLDLLVATILQDPSITVEQAAQLSANTRAAALRMFPGAEATYNMLCRPRVQRAMRERFRLQ